MPESQIAEHVAAVRRYLATAKGRRKVVELMYGRGLSFERAIGEIAIVMLANCHNGRLREVSIEDFNLVAHRVMDEELRFEVVA